MLDNHDESFFLYKQKLIVLSKSNTIKCHVRNRYVVWFYAIGKNRIDTERQRKPCRKVAEIQKDLPVLQEVLNGTWAKESRLSELKTELAAVERKKQLSITPETKADASEQAEKQKEVPQVQQSIERIKSVHLPRGLL